MLDTKIDHVIKNWSAPIYCRDLDTTTLRDLIDSEGRLIPDDLQPGVPRVGIPRPPRASMQNLYDGMGRMEIPMRRQRGWSIGIQIIGTGTGEIPDLENLMTEDDSLFYHEVAFLPVQYEVGLLAPLQHLIYVLEVVVRGTTEDGEVFHKYFHDIPD
ncbi:hypothetical protein Tco_0826618 [Tanacetum coccineum]